MKRHFCLCVALFFVLVLQAEFTYSDLSSIQRDFTSQNKDQRNILPTFIQYAKTYEDSRGVFSPYFDLLTSNEYVNQTTEDELKNTQLVSLNKIAVMYPPYFGLEVDYKTLNAERETPVGSTFYRQGHSQRILGLGAGFPDAKWFRLMIFSQSFAQEISNLDVPSGISSPHESDVSFGGLKIETQKSVIAKSQKLIMGAEYEKNSVSGGFDSSWVEYVSNNFPHTQLQWAPKTRFQIYTYATDLDPQYDEPIYLNGLAPVTAPLHITNRITYLLGLRYVNETYKAVNNSENDTEHRDFKGEMNFNFTRYVGLDLAYLYHQYLASAVEDDTETGIRQVGVRLNIVDLDIVRVQSLIEYQMVKGGDLDNRMNVAANLVVRFTKYLSLRSFIRLNNEWDIKKGAFEFIADDTQWGAVFSARL